MTPELSSGVMHLLRKCPCPVWVVRPARQRQGIRVLAAVNPSEEHESGRALALYHDEKDV